VVPTERVALNGRSNRDGLSVLKKISIEQQPTEISPNLFGGRFAPRWWYFNFYLLCRRQQRLPGMSFDPAFAALNSLGAGIAMPLLIIILLIDECVNFLHPLGRMWISLNLPGSPQKAWVYALGVVTFVTGSLILSIFFGGRYKKIMQAFIEYDSSSRDLMPTIICGIIWMVIVLISALAIISYMHGLKSMLLIATILNCCIFVTAEVAFRLWWKSWLRHKDAC
jgi:hypothetical protein